ncbi:type III-A CRISPR-associated RAMP protein Csm3 [Desulfovibrio sp. ZJ369]|uniref:type III-A CRISPR-associated RAMP protein Csm3 n=1 Tax=Desulfovibrio sp. ZJ369 TaxID=2709793 RepID=UPI0013EC08DF|nr:type III-A CRISPR-associated RAMP protein Csm3 [Desulfovibrio sp. ZJ369]
MQLQSIRTLTGRIRLRTGLHIGAGKETVEIGGLDQPIVKDPLSGAPYIPGSSLKGKMRSLLEVGIVMGTNPETRKCITKGAPCGCGRADCPVCVLFGAHNDPGKCDPKLGPTRLLVRDAMLCKEDRKRFAAGQLSMEIKYENTINRVNGTAEHPRPLERVPAGVAFELSIALKVFEHDDADELAQWLFKALRLVELDALGGGSSRGNGQVAFEDLALDGEPVDLAGIRAL